MLGHVRTNTNRKREHSLLVLLTPNTKQMTLCYYRENKAKEM